MSSGHIDPTDVEGRSFIEEIPGDEPMAATITFDVNGRPQQQQPNQFNDVPWGLAFLAHIAVICVVISMNIVKDGGFGQEINSSAGILPLVCIAALVSMGLSSTTIVLMMKYPTESVRVALVFSGVLVCCLMVMSFFSGDVVVIIMPTFLFVLTVWYIYRVWNRIPFAAANLKTALSAVRSNVGLSCVAYFMTIVTFAWSGFWMMGMASVATENAGIVFLLFVSFYWTVGVFTNTVHVTTAGTVGTWWFVPGEASSCFSTGLKDSFCRATTYSFGSICFGSLVVAVIRALRAMARQRSRNGEFLRCIAECILACIANLVEYFNKWAYVYVGLYGFGYIEAGKNVLQLFEQRGWTSIVTDDLCDRVLMMMNIGVGATTGIISMFLVLFDKSLLADDVGDSPIVKAFFLGFLVGAVVCSILMSVVSSAVNTVIVCFAESPNEFETNHPALSQEMRSSWAQSYPDLTI